VKISVNGLELMAGTKQEVTKLKYETPTLKDVEERIAGQGCCSGKP